jgi:hypothetical protein
MKKAIALLCYQPHQHLLDFYRSIEGYDFYCICDAEDPQIQGPDIITVADETCKKAGYTHSCNVVQLKRPNKDITILAWDKAIYYFCDVNQSYDQVWFIEDDVFVPTVHTLPVMDIKYGGQPDLLTREHISPADNNPARISSWTCSKDNYPEPWFTSMGCCRRVSRRLLDHIRDYAKERRRIYFHEPMFNTIAHHKKCKIVLCEELYTVAYRCNINNYRILDISKCYHAIKNIEDQKLWHSYFGFN